MKRITVDLEDGLYQRLRRAAFDREESVSEAIREALVAWLPGPDQEEEQDQ
jgi:hypothetical protein